MRTAAALVVALTACGSSSPALAQPVVVEADLTGGYTSDHAGALATQVRAFGDVPFGVRVLAEAAWAARSETDESTDAFGAAYPYGNRIQIIEAYAERLFHPGTGLRRIPRRTIPDTVRDLCAWRLCVLGISPRAADSIRRIFRALQQLSGARRGVDCRHSAAVRRNKPQCAGRCWRRLTAIGGRHRHAPSGYYGPWIVGVSHIRTQPYSPERFAQGRSVFTGVDLRWTAGGVQVSGEWITGQPFDGTSTHGVACRRDGAPPGHGSGHGRLAFRAARLRRGRAVRPMGPATHRRRTGPSASESQRAGQRPSPEWRLDRRVYHRPRRGPYLLHQASLEAGALPIPGPGLDTVAPPHGSASRAGRERVRRPLARARADRDHARGDESIARARLERPRRRADGVRAARREQGSVCLRTNAADYGAPGISSAHERCPVGGRHRHHRRHGERLPPATQGAVLHRHRWHWPLAGEPRLAHRGEIAPVDTSRDRPGGRRSFRSGHRGRRASSCFS